MDNDAVLPPLVRLALAWQPASSRAELAWRFELDEICARIIITRNEPVLAQISLAWWDEQLENGRAEHPHLVNICDRQRRLAQQIVAAWRAIASQDAPYTHANDVLLAGRAAIFALPSDDAVLLKAAETWAMWDLSRRLEGHPAGQNALKALDSCQFPVVKMSRHQRCLAVLYDAARRNHLTGADPMSRKNLLIAARIGTLGR